MISSEYFARIDAQVQSIMGNKEPFGGLSIICFGDFWQIPPPGNCCFRQRLVRSPPFPPFFFDKAEQE